MSGSMGMGGEIFLLDMGEPVKITDLAEDLIRLSGLTPYEDVDIKFSGLRPGEKLYEELLIEGEGIKPTEHKKILIADAVDVDTADIEASFQQLKFLSKKAEPEEIVSKFREMVPEYSPNRGPALSKQQKKIVNKRILVRKAPLHAAVENFSTVQPTL